MIGGQGRGSRSRKGSRSGVGGQGLGVGVRWSVGFSRHWVKHGMEWNSIMNS